jgi:hypothetical protein
LEPNNYVSYNYYCCLLIRENAAVFASESILGMVYAVYSKKVVLLLELGHKNADGLPPTWYILCVDFDGCCLAGTGTAVILMELPFMFRRNIQLPLKYFDHWISVSSRS